MTERSRSDAVKLEVTLSMDTLRRLVPGAVVRLEVAGVSSASGEALITESSNPYQFMEEYDADSEEEPEEEDLVCKEECPPEIEEALWDEVPELVKATSEDENQDELIDDLSDSEEEPCDTCKPKRYKFYAVINWGIYERYVMIACMDPGRWKGFNDRREAEQWLHAREEAS